MSSCRHDRAPTKPQSLGTGRPHRLPSNAVTGLKQWAEGLWTLEGEPIRFVGFPYELRMTIVRLDDGSLWLHSPVQCTDANRALVDELGPVRHLVTPNKLHHLFLGQWAERYPEATVYAAPGLPERRPDLRIDTVLGDEAPPAWRGALEQIVIGPSLFMDEVVFFHRPSKTLIVGDLVENHDPSRLSGWRLVVAELNHMLGPNAETPRNWQLTFLDREQTRARVEQLVAWRPERVIVMHGLCVDDDVDAWLRHALGWALSGASTGPGHHLEQEDVKRFYDAFGKRQDWQAVYEGEAVAAMIDHADFAQASAVFELGSGTGRLAERLLDTELPADARYFATDVSETMMDLAQGRLARFGDRVTLRRGDGTLGNDLPAGSVDRFVSTYVFDLLGDEATEAALAEAHRLLAPGGRLCLVSLTHGHTAWERLLEGAWLAAWRRAPDKVGGCRPVDLQAHLPADRWRVDHHETVSAFGLCSEVLVATPAGS